MLVWCSAEDFAIFVVHRLCAASLHRMVGHPAFFFFTEWSNVFITVSDGWNSLWQADSLYLFGRR